MRQTKTFVEQELERERRLSSPPKPGFKLLNRRKFIFVNRPIQQSEARRKAIEKAKADYRYDVEYFTISDTPQLICSQAEAEVLSAEELRRLAGYEPEGESYET